MNCKFCGKKIAKNSKFCSNCGASIEETKEAVIVEDIKDNNNENKEQIKYTDNSNNRKNRTNGILVSSIIVTSLSLLTLSFIPLTFGIIAIVFAAIYKSEMIDQIAEKKKYNSLIMGIIAWITFGVGLIIKLVLGVIFASLFAYLINIVETKSPEEIEAFFNDKIEWIEELESDNKYKYDAVKYKVESKYEYLTEIDYSRLKELYEDDDQSIVVLVQEKCHICKIYMPILNEIAKSTKLNIYYLDVSKIDDTTYYEMVGEIDYFVNDNTIFTPTTLIVGSSRTFGSLEGYTPYTQLKDFLKLHSIIK